MWKLFLVIQFILFAGCFKGLGQVVKRKDGYLITFNEDDLSKYSTVRQLDTTFNKRLTVKIERIDTSAGNRAIYLHIQARDSSINTRLEVFDKRNNLIFISVAMKGVVFEKYSFLYDEKGRLIEKSGYGSGDNGSTITIKYD